MHSIVSHIVVAALTLHTLLGCCWHHAHASSDVVMHVDADDSEHVGHCCGHRHRDDVASRADVAKATHDVVATHQDDEHPAPEPCSETCGDKCQFVATSRVELESPTMLHIARLDFVTVFQVAGEVSLVRFEPGHAAAPPRPIRLHLWNRLLLI